MHNAPLSVNFSTSLSSTGEAGQKQPIAELRRVLQQKIDRRLFDVESLMTSGNVRDLSFNEPILDQSGKGVGMMTIAIGRNPD